MRKEPSGKSLSPFKLTVVALACALAYSPVAVAQTAKTSELGAVTITGDGDKLGSGLIVQEDSAKARSNVTRSELVKERPTGNPFQSMDILPGVNTYSYDGTGLFGGGLTIRGFNSDQLGITVNGAPVNDSGSFAVYPQEYADVENTCAQFVTQGSTDVDAPHVGATGGNVGIVTCDPEDKQRFRVAQTVGGDKLKKSFVRVDTGRFANDMAKLYVSYSHAEADKWKGAGGAIRDHVDSGVRFDIDKDNYITGSLLLNRAINNNFYTVSAAQIQQNGYYYDYATTFNPGHLTPVNGTAQTEAISSPAFYKLSVNPFENAIASATGVFKLAQQTQLKVQPYYWFGYGTGGTQEKAVSESAFLNTVTGKLTGTVDLNGDGDTKDKIIMASSSVTRTNRPGINISVTRNWENHQLMGGVWMERATHKQTQPMVAVDANGNPSDIWLQNGLIDRPNGTPYEGRDWKTISTAYQLFLQDSISFMDDKLLLTFGFRTPHVKRDFTNYASEGSNSQIGYNITKSYSDILPQLGARYNLTPSNQVFANIAKNFKAPPNFAYSPTGNNVQIVNGVATMVGNVAPETSVNVDIGYRYQGNDFTASASVFHVDFRNRQSNAYDPTLDLSIYTNAGSVTNNGFELEIGTTPVNGWSVYGSLTNNNSRINNDVVVGKNQVLPTNGREFTLTPDWMSGLSLQYAEGNWYGRFKAKYTGRQAATLVNDEMVPGYVTADFDAGFKFKDVSFLKNPTLRFNISNVFNRQYRNSSSQSSSNANSVNGIAGSTVYYYLGAPRLMSATLTFDF